MKTKPRGQERRRAKVPRRGARFARIELGGFSWWRPSLPLHVRPAETLDRPQGLGRPVRTLHALRLPEAAERARYEPNGLDVLNALAQTRADEGGLRNFVVRFGPLWEPGRDRLLDVDEALIEVGRLHVMARDWKTALRHGEVLKMFSAVGQLAKGAVSGFGYLQRYVTPTFNEYAAAHLRLAIEALPDSTFELVARPADLLGLAWLTLASRILRGELTGDCRNKECQNKVDRSLRDGNSMQRMYCVEDEANCRMKVTRNPKKYDRWPMLRGKTKSQRRRILRGIFTGEMKVEEAA